MKQKTNQLHSNEDASSVERHYDKVLAGVYSWLAGDFNEIKQRNSLFFRSRGISPRSSGTAVDLGAGPGFQSVALAELGYAVTAIDISEQSLNELRGHALGFNVRIIRDDLMHFQNHCRDKVELIVCMTDTLAHLPSVARVETLFRLSHQTLEQGGKLILTFRDYSRELIGLDRFIPVKSDEETVFTCFLEYEPETVKVHDLVYRKTNGQWRFDKGCYRKIRISRSWVEQQVTRTGFKIVESSQENGFVTLICQKCSE